MVEITMVNCVINVNVEIGMNAKIDMSGLKTIDKIGMDMNGSISGNSIAINTVNQPTFRTW